MPLILISGFPSSGKTYRSNQLIDNFTQRIADSDNPRIKRLKIQHIDDDGLGLARDVYASARAEKDARAALSSAIKRHLTRDTLVVADAMNYIKGFRYQLYCEAKAVQTPSCVVQIGVPAERCRALNDAALQRGSGYVKEIFENLVFRYEEPNGMSRWDAPLFVIPYDDAMPPCDAIWDAMVGGGADGKAKLVRPNAATVLKPAAEQNYLYELDRATSEVVAAVTAWVRDHAGEGGGGGGEVPIAEAQTAVVLPTATLPSLAQMQRLRRQFIALNRQHTLEKSRLRELFVDYLNSSFQQ